MAFSIETRVPFLDHRLIEFVHSLEDNDIICLGTTKYILRNSLDDFLPKAIADRVHKQPFFGRRNGHLAEGSLKIFDRCPL